MTWRRLALALAVTFAITTLPLSATAKSSGSPVEPAAGQWRTWSISSGKDYRVAPPPAPNETRAELRALDALWRDDYCGSVIRPLCGR